MFSQILCATDLSPRSDEALHVAVHMAARYGARLTILNVHEEFMDKSEMVMLRVSVDQMQDHFKSVAMKAREQMEKQVTAQGIDELQVEYLLREGRPAETIITVAEELQEKLPDPEAPLIVMGTNGRNDLMERLLGSVAEHVVRHASCPVLVIPYVRR